MAQLGFELTTSATPPSTALSSKSSSKVLLLCNYISLTPNIYLISLVFSESGRLLFANGIDATHKEELYLRRVLH